MSTPKNAAAPESIVIKPLIRIISGPGCVQCKATKRELFERQGIDERLAEMIDITEPGVREIAEATGHRSLPIVTFNNDHWGGFNPPKLAGAVPALKAATEKLHAAEAALVAAAEAALAEVEAEADEDKPDEADSGPSL